MSVTRSSGVDPNDPFAVHPAPEPDPDEVTPARAAMLAAHAIHVQGGVSDPEREAERARAQLARSPGSIDWDRMQAELVEAQRTKREAEEPASDSHPLDVGKVRLYQRLRDAEKAADEEAAALKEEADKLQEELIAMFAENGLQNLNVDGRTVYLHRSIFAQRKPGVTSEDVQAALRAAGEDDLIKETVNGNTLNAWVRELTEDDDAAGLPEEVAAVLEPGERFSVRIIAGGTKAKSKTHSK